MSRYQVLRRIKCDRLTAGVIALLNWACGVPDGTIVFLTAVMHYDLSEDA